MEEARSTLRQVQKILSESDQSASLDGIVSTSFKTATIILMINIFL